MRKGGKGFLKAVGGRLPGAYRGICENKAYSKGQRATYRDNPLISTSEKSSYSPLIAQDSLLILDGLVGSISGDEIIKGRIEGDPEEGEILGVQLADDILSKGAKEILDEVYKRCAPPVNGEISS